MKYCFPAARSRFLALALGALVVLSACGGGAGGGGAQPPADTPPPVVVTPPGPVDTVAPASVAYATPQPLYFRSEAITTNSPQVTGGAARAFTVAPALPTGLSLDATTGAITGTPAAVQSQATYTVTASNAAGSASTQLLITVTARGSWAATAPILPGRHYHAATKLADGRVLATGGFTVGGVTNAATLYDPATSTWTPLPGMLSPRHEHTATLLPDGRVLVVGGQPVSPGAATVTAEIYDPVSNSWTPTGSMAQARLRHTATLLPNGQVLVIGGTDFTGTTIFRDTAERYDPVTGSWTLLNNRLAFPRTQHAAELLPDGNTVLVAAGINLAVGFVTTSELLRADDSAPTTTMPASGGSGTVAQSVRLADGSVLVTTDGATAWRFHPATSDWTTSSLGAGRSLPIMTRLADGRVLLAGGSNLATAEIYNPDVNVWTVATPMVTVRRAAAAALLNDGTVLVIGGFSTAGGEVDAVEIYTP